MRGAAVRSVDEPAEEWLALGVLVTREGKSKSGLSLPGKRVWRGGGGGGGGEGRREREEGETILCLRQLYINSHNVHKGLKGEETTNRRMVSNHPKVHFVTPGPPLPS